MAKPAKSIATSVVALGDIAMIALVWGFWNGRRNVWLLLRSIVLTELWAGMKRISSLNMRFPWE